MTQPKTTAPMQRAVDAAVAAVHAASDHGRDGYAPSGWLCNCADKARLAVTAAWPHLRDAHHDYNDLERIRTLQQALAARNEQIGRLEQIIATHESRRDG